MTVCASIPCAPGPLALAEIVVPGAPVGKARARSAPGRRRPYTPARTAAWETQCGWLAAQAMRRRDPFAGAVVLHVLAVLEVPGSWSMARRAEALAGTIAPEVKPDFDNVEKIVADSLSGIVYRDDKQVVDSMFSKRYGREAMVRIRVMRWAPSPVPWGITP